MNIKDIAKRFILFTYGEDERTFETMWEHISKHYDELKSSENKQQRIKVGGLGISGAGFSQAAEAVFIFQDAERGLVSAKLNLPEEIMEFIRDTASKRGNEYFVKLFERFANKYGVEISDKKSEIVACYARIWTRDTELEGNLITKDEFDRLLKEKKEYKVFILDEGEFEQGHVGAVYIDGQLWSKIEDESRDEEREGYLSALFYRILVHTLKNRYKAGDAGQLFDKCWNEPARAKNLKKLGKNERQEQQGKCRKAFAVLNKLLRKEMNTEITASRDGVYCMNKKIVYCIVATSEKCLA